MQQGCCCVVCELLWRFRLRLLLNLEGVGMPRWHLGCGRLGIAPWQLDLQPGQIKSCPEPPATSGEGDS
jgi:hypothetical protein